MEKDGVFQADTAVDVTEPKRSQSTEDLDEAYKFLELHGSTSSLNDTAIAQVTRKCDWHIIPLLTFNYFLQALDKQLLNYAAVAGLTRDLHLTTDQFSNAATALFAALLVAEVPNAYFLNKVPVAKWLAANAVLCGVATACTAACTNSTGLIVVRVFLGVFEAGLQPSSTLIASQYYRKDEQVSRFVVWGSGIGFAIILGGLLSFGFQHVHHAALAGWKVMFVVLGGVGVLYGVFVYFYLPDTPMKARFLTDSEKATLLHHVSANKTGVRNTTFKMAHIKELLLDPQIGMLTLLTVLVTMASGVTLTYSSTLIRNFGYTPEVASLLNLPSGVVTLLACAAVVWMSTTRLPRWTIIVLTILVVILGAGLMSFAPESNRGALLTGVYLVNCSTPLLLVMFQWTSANVAGQTKRTVAVSLIAAAFSAGSLIGPQTFKAKDAPQFIPAKITLLAVEVAAAVLAGLLGLYYFSVNRRRDRKYGKSDALDQVQGGRDERLAWENLTDGERKSFRYMY